MKKLLLCIFLCGIVPPLYSQMPDWHPFRDRENNLYYIDGAGRIYITKENHDATPLITPANYEYYYNLALRDYKDGNHIRAIRTTGSILALPGRSRRLRKFQEQSVQLQQEMARRQGSRFQHFLRQASPYRYRYDDKTVCVDVVSRWKVAYGGEMLILNRTERQAYRGVSLALKDETTPEDRFSALLSIDTMEFSIEPRGLETAEEQWGKLVAPVTERQRVSKDEDSGIYRISRDGGAISGFERVVLYGKRSSIVRLVCSTSLFESREKEFQKLVETIRFIQ